MLVRHFTFLFSLLIILSGCVTDKTNTGAGVKGGGVAVQPNGTASDFTGRKGFNYSGRTQTTDPNQTATVLTSILSPEKKVGDVVKVKAASGDEIDATIEVLGPFAVVLAPVIASTGYIILTKDELIGDQNDSNAFGAVAYVRSGAPFHQDLVVFRSVAQSNSKFSWWRFKTGESTIRPVFIDLGYFLDPLALGTASFWETIYPNHKANLPAESVEGFTFLTRENPDRSLIATYDGMSVEAYYPSMTASLNY